MKKFLVFEGIHGSGKSFIPKKLEEKWQSEGIKAQYFHFPNEEEDLGKIIRSAVANPVLFDKWQATGLLYAAHANIFHFERNNDETTYLLSRHSVSTGLIFQKEMSRETRLEIYGPGIQALKENGIVFYLKTDPNLAAERKEVRNDAMRATQKEQVRQDKANDQFVAQKYEQLAREYEENMIPQLEKLGIPAIIVDNNGTVEETIQQIESILQNN